MSGVQQDSLFASIHTGHLPAIWSESGKEVNTPEVLRMLEFSEDEAANAAQVPPDQVQPHQPPPKELVERARQWAIMLEMVAGFFEGDAAKTVLWFKTPNPMLGGLTPREMIQFGRADKLKEIIEDALAGNLP